MLRLILFLAFIIAMASGLAWLADRPGLIVVNWEGYQAEISVFHAVVALALMTGLALVAWSLLRHVWESPAMIGSAMMVTGKWSGDGVFNMEQMDPDPFMDMLNDHGLPWQVKEMDGPVNF